MSCTLKIFTVCKSENLNKCALIQIFEVFRRILRFFERSKTGVKIVTFINVKFFYFNEDFREAKP